MVISVLLFLWGCFILFLLAAMARKALSKGEIYEFQNYGKADIPYITLDIQGFCLNFIVDTGCGVSIISADALDSLEFSESQRKIQLEALTPDSLDSHMVTVPLNVGNSHLEEDFVVYDKADIANFQAHYGIVIHGIIGNEFLDRTGCQIDYKNHIVVIP